MSARGRANAMRRAPTGVAWGVRWASASLVLACAATAFAQAGGGFELVRRTADGGGGRSTGGGFAVTGTPGQPDAGRLAGGAFVLQGGFHRRAVAVPAGDVVFAAGFE